MQGFVSSYSTRVCDVCWWKAAFLQCMSGDASKGSRIGTRFDSDKFPHFKSCWENRLVGIQVSSGFIKMFTQPNKSFLYKGSGSASIADFGLMVFILLCSQDHVWKDKVLQNSPKYWTLVQSWADAAKTSKRSSEQMWQSHPEVIRLFLNNISGCFFLTHSKS